MNLQHWSLTLPPFGPQPDSRFLFATRQHERALAALSYAACEGGEPALLIGPPGCGKTLLFRALRRELPADQWQVGFVPEAGAGGTPLLVRAAYHLGGRVTTDMASAMDVILRAAEQADGQNRTLVLLLDGWRSTIAPERVDELRWLFNLVVENARLCVLLNSSDVDAANSLPPAVADRLFATIQLDALSADQVAPYIDHRLRVAGREDTFFAPSAASLIALWSGGSPRLVNRVANLAMHVAYLERAARVENEAVRHAIERLDAGRAGSAPVPTRITTTAPALAAVLASGRGGLP